MKPNDCKASPECGYAAEAAEIAVKRVFAILGVDIDKPESVEEFREDLRFGKRLRKGADHGFLAFVAILTTGVAAALWAGITTKVTGGP